MHKRREFTIHKVERWSKLHALPLRVKVHLKAKMYGETSGATLVDVLNRQTLKPKSPLMRGEILRTLDLEHLFQLDQEGAYCRDGYLYESNIFQCCPEIKYRHACECAEDEVPELLVDVDDVGCAVGKV